MKTCEQFIKDKEEEMKNGLLPFNSDPEVEMPYYSIYQNDKLIGRSNREAALLLFLYNVKLTYANSDEDLNMYITFDESYLTDNEGNIAYHKYEITKQGRVNGSHNELYSKLLLKLMSSTK